MSSISTNPKNLLEYIKAHTTVVVDTGDFQSIEKYRPTDATTNPSLLLAASQLPTYGHLVDDALSKSGSDSSANTVELALDKLIVNFGYQILQIIPGRVSTEVDARLSFDTQGTIQKALHLISLYKEMGIDTSKRVLIKVASTWEGIQAARVLEKDHGVACNLTLLFSFTQAIACAEANVTLISPFVGRIYDWYLQRSPNQASISPHEDPGVQSVRKIYHYYKYFNVRTIVMGASFRSIGQIMELVGCDYLTISPTLLGELEKTPASSNLSLAPKLTVAEARQHPMKKITLDEKSFRWELNQDQMATEKLAEGIRKFADDALKLESYLSSKL